MVRDFLETLAGSSRLLERVRRIVVGGAVAGLGVIGAPSIAAHPADTASGQVTPTPTIVDRSRKAAKLILRLPAHFTSLVAQHRSHASHSSHRSHSSHFSGTSGTASGSAGTTSPPPSTSAAATPLAELMPNQVSGKFVSFDAKQKLFRVRDSSGTLREFTLRDDTALTVASGLPASRIDEYLETHATGLPFRTGQDVVVTWKTSADSTKRVATFIR
jgi:hypothetical protein